MKSFQFFLLTALLLPLSLCAQTLEWAQRVGGKGNDAADVLEFDAAGNMYISGTYNDDLVDFDPGPGVFNLDARYNETNSFVLKLDAAGNFIWAKSLDGPGLEPVYDMTIDAQGNLYLTGFFQDSVDFDPGPGIYNLRSNGYLDAFVCKLDSAGHLLWARSMGSLSDDEGRSIAVDAAGGVYTVGQYDYPTDFDPSPAPADTFTLSGSFDDIFIQKLDADGHFQWARRFGELYSDKVYDVKVCPDGQLLVYGDVTGSPRYGTIASTDTITVNSTDPFLLRINADNGNLIWAKNFGGPSLDLGSFMQLDADGNIYTGGSFRGSADMDPGPDSFLLTSVGIRNNFLQKLDPNGNFLWALRYPDTVQPTDLERDVGGNLIISGFLLGTADVDPGPPVQYLTASGDYDFFVQKLDPDLEQIWVKQVGGPGHDACTDLRTDSDGAFFFTGLFQDSLDADPGPGSTMLKSKKKEDLFVIKWREGLDFQGRVFQDLNNNQVFDAGEPPLSGVVLAVPNVGQYTTTNSLGKFRFNAAVTGDTLVAVMPRTFWTVSPVYHLPDSSQAPLDFAVTIQTGVQDLTVSAIALTPFRPGRNTELQVQVRNNGSARADSIAVHFSIEDLPNWLSLTAAEPPPLAIFGDSLVWQIDSLEIDSVRTFHFTLHTASTALPNTPIHYVAEAMLAGDIYPADNRFEVKTQVTGSYDPNDKQVSPALFSPLLLDSIDLRYVIRFQNTGNFPAEQVRLLDTLAESLDLATLRLIATSHPCTWRLLPGRVLEFLFADIALPDSISDEPGSHGFAAFSIRPRQNLAPGDSIGNRAGIYFDFNAPVMTNRAITALDRDQDGDGYFSQEDCNDLLAAINPGAVEIPGNGLDENCDGLDALVATGEAPMLPLSLWPNPAHDRLLIGFGAAETGTLEIWTATGQLLLRQHMDSRSSYTALTADYPRGVCILRFRSDSGRLRLGRFVLE